MPFKPRSDKPRGRSSGRPGERKFGGKPGSDREGRGRQDGERGGGRFFRKKVCRFCSDRILAIDFKETEKLTRFLTEKGKIVPRRITGNCAKHQRFLARALKRARHSALLAFQVD